MKRLITVFSLAFLVSGANLPVNSMNVSLGTKTKSGLHKFGDALRGRKNNATTSDLDKIAIDLKGGADACQSVITASDRYLKSIKYAVNDQVYTSLLAFKQFLTSVLSLLTEHANLLEASRGHYTILLGAENKIGKAGQKVGSARTEKTIDKNRQKVSIAESNMLKILNLLTGTGIDALSADVKCDSIILLRTLQSTYKEFSINIATIMKSIATLATKFDKLLPLVDGNLPDILSSCADSSGMDKNKLENKTDEFINILKFINEVLKISRQRVSGMQVRDTDAERLITQISGNANGSTGRDSGREYENIYPQRRADSNGDSHIYVERYTRDEGASRSIGDRDSGADNHPRREGDRSPTSKGPDGRSYDGSGDTRSGRPENRNDYYPQDRRLISNGVSGGDYNRGNDTRSRNRNDRPENYDNNYPEQDRNPASTEAGSGNYAEGNGTSESRRDDLQQKSYRNQVW